MTQTVQIDANGPLIGRRLTFFHDGPLRLEIRNRDVGEEIVFTLAADSGADPVVQQAGLDVIELDAATLAVVPEGETYHYNVWSRVGDVIEIIERGLIDSRRTIAPTDDTPVVAEPLSVSAGAVSEAAEGDAFTFAAMAQGGNAPYNSALGAAPLPDGVSLNAVTGVVSGTPTVAGAFAGIVIEVTDDAGATAQTPPFAITVTAAIVAPTPSLSFTASEDAPLLLIDGDSIMAYNATRLILEHYVGGQFRKPDGFNQARGGDSTQQILDGVPNVIDLIEPNKTVVLVGPTGANQGLGSSTFAEISDQQQQIYDAYLAAGAVVVAVPTLAQEDLHNNSDKMDALMAWVYAHETGGTVNYDGVDYTVSARDNFYALDTGTADRSQTGAAAYGADTFNPYTMKDDQTHPNGAGSRYLAEKLAVLLSGLVTSDIFARVGTNLLGADATFAGSIAASRPGITGDVPANWSVSRSGGLSTWACAKNGAGHLVASIANAGDQSTLSVAIDADINGAEGDVFDLVVEVEVDGAENGFRGLVLIGESGSALQGDADYYPGRSTLVLRTISTPLAAGETTKTFTIQSLVETGATCSVTFKRAALFFVENIAGALSIGGPPDTVVTVGVPYDFAPTVSGGAAPYSFDLVSSVLPTGITLDPATGAVSGTPTAAGTMSGIVLRVTDTAAQTATLTAFSIEVQASGAPENSALPTLSTSTPAEGEDVTVTDGTWSNVPTTFEYRWKHSGNVQTGEDTASHTPGVGSAPQTVTAEVRASNASGTSAWASTAQTAAITPAATLAPWDTAMIHGEDLSYSDEDRTVSNGAIGNRHVKGTQVLSGQVYYEVEITTLVRAIGVSDETVTATDTMTLGTNTVFWAGVAILSNTNSNVGGGYVDGDVVQVSVDVDNGLIWVRKNGVGEWNGDVGADPSTGVLGIDISGLTSATLYAMVSMKPGGSAALHGSADRFLFTPPAGYAPIA